jgi:hypothetical protein
MVYVDPSGHDACTGIAGTYEPDCGVDGWYGPSVPDTGDPTTPFQVGVEWLTGQGPRHHEFQEGDPFTELLQQHEHVQEVRLTMTERLSENNYAFYSEPYDLSGVQGVPKYIKDYSTLATFGTTGNLAVTFLGSYELVVYVVNVNEREGTAEVFFVVNNSSTLGSGTRPPVLGYMPLWTQNIEPVINNITQGGPMSPVTQTFTWVETISFK